MAEKRTVPPLTALDTLSRHSAAPNNPPTKGAKRRALRLSGLAAKEARDCTEDAFDSSPQLRQ